MKSGLLTCSLDMEAEALRKFAEAKLFDEVGLIVSTLHSLLRHEHPEESVEADLASALLREVESDVVELGVVDWTSFPICVGQLAAQ